VRFYVQHIVLRYESSLRSGNLAFVYPHAPDAESHDPNPQPESAPVQHHSVYCPNCSAQLTGHRCKLVCNRCGYYLSCADYY
jgi:ribosomal protein S27AE